MIVYPHRIRLRGPWQCEPLARMSVQNDGTVTISHADLPQPRRMTMPCRWDEGGLADFTGCVRFRRRFGYPGTIDDFERVWLTIAGIKGDAVVSLNDHELVRVDDGVGQWQGMVTELLQPRNELIVDVESLREAGGLTEEVALEIRRTAYLQDVRATVTADGRVRVNGRVMGEHVRPLEIYLLQKGKTNGYHVVEASADGTVFSMTSEEPFAAGVPIQVELIDGGVVWHTMLVS